MANNTAEFFDTWQKNQGRMKEAVPNVMRGFGGLFQAAMKEGALTVREKELIALGIGLAIPCVPCINLHVEKCLKAGATREQILEATGVSVVMRGGPSLTHIPEVIDALDHCQAKG